MELTNNHKTKYLGDSAVALVLFDLTKKGYFVSSPLSENSPYDLVCDTGEALLKIQVKYRTGESVFIPNKTSWADKNGSHARHYDDGAFDYFAMVCEDFKKVCYPHISQKGRQMWWNYPEQPSREFLYYEDFLDFDREASCRFSYISGASLVDINNMTRKELRELINKSSSQRDVYESLGISWNRYKKLLDKYEL